MELNQNFALRLKELMHDNQIIATDVLAEAIGCSGASVRMWRLGKSLPNLSSAVRLANYFNCSLDYLFGRSTVDLDFEIFPSLHFYDRFISLLQLHKVSWYNIVKTTKLSKRNLHDWHKGSDPSIPTLTILADHLDCSLDYLIGSVR